MKNLNIWTVDEYYTEMKKYFSNQQDNRVIKIIAPCGFGGGYHYWIKPSLMPFDKQVDIWWNYEPLMIKKYFDTKEELAENMNPELKNAHGFSLRWLFREDEIVYQISAIIGKVDELIDDLMATQNEEYLLGFKMDPFTYIKKLPIKKATVDEEEKELIDSKSPDLKVADNYRVFWEEITPGQFLEEEKLYTDKNMHLNYHDDIVEAGYKLNKDIIEFLKIYTDFRYD